MKAHRLPRFILHTSSFILLFFLSACSESKKEARSLRETTKAMEAELKELKAKAELESQRIQQLEEQIKVQNRLADLEKEQEKIQADFEAYREYFQAQSQQSSPPDPTEDLALPSPANSSSTPKPYTPPTPSPSDQNPDNGGFSFVAVRSIPPTPPASAPQATQAPGLTPPNPPNMAATQRPLTPEQARIALLRQQLREEIITVFQQIKERRQARYGEKNGQGDETYIQLKSYNPETGKNKRGGKKPELAVDLESGLNQEFPENSTCLDNLSLSATFVKARLIRSEIIELKNQMKP